MTLWVDLAYFLLYIQCQLGLESQSGWKEWSLQHWFSHMPCAWVGEAEVLDSAGLLAHLDILPAASSPRATSFPQGLTIRVARLLSTGSSANGTFIPMAC